MKKGRSSRGRFVATWVAVVASLLVAVPLRAELVMLMDVYDPWPGDPKTTETYGTTVAISPDGRHVYVVREESYSISIYERDTSGALTFLADAPSSFAKPHCQVGGGCNAAFEGHQALAFSADGRHLYACVSGAARIVLYHRDTVTGLLTEGDDYPPSGTCSLSMNADDTKLYVLDLGGVRIMSRDVINGTLTLEQTAYPELPFLLGMAVSPDESNIYVPSRDAVALGVLRRDPVSGMFAVEQIVHDGFFVPGYEHATPGSVAVSPDGAHVYVGVRVGDQVLPPSGSIAIFDRDPDTGHLTLSEVVRNSGEIGNALFEPRKLLMSSDGSRLVVQGQYEIALFARDTATGGLTFRGRDDAGCSVVGAFTGAAVSGDATDIYANSVQGAGRQGLVYWYRIQGPSSSAPCSATPLTGCEPAFSSSLTIRSGDSVSKNRLLWSWNGGGVGNNDFGGGDFMTCTYTDDGSGFVLIHQSLAPAACWVPTAHGWVLSSSSSGFAPQSRARMSKVRLKSKSTATGFKRIIRLLAKRADVLPPQLPLSAVSTTLVQFVAGDGRCWEDRYSGDDVVQNDGQQFKAKRRSP